MNKIDSIKKRYYQIAKQVGAPKKYVEFRTTPSGDGSPHIEFSTLYYYVVSERGNEFERRPTNNPDEILYWLISDLTSSMSIDHELRNRDESEDCRRKMFKKNIELLESINPDWAIKMKNEYDAILKEHPYNDNKS